MKTFAEMIEVLKQHAAGLLTDAEAIMACQLNQKQLEAIQLMMKLPQPAQLKVNLVDMEPDWERQRELVQAQAPRLQSPLEDGGYYRTRLGVTYKVTFDKERNHFYCVDANLIWGSQGSDQTSIDLDEEESLYDLVGPGIEDEWHNRANIKGFYVELERYYRLNNGAAVYLDRDVFVQSALGIHVDDHPDLGWNHSGTTKSRLTKQYSAIKHEITQVEYERSRTKCVYGIGGFVFGTGS